MAKKRKPPKKKSRGPNSPVRVLVECSPHRITGGGSFPGLTELDVEHESYLEHDALAAITLCHDVRFIRSQASKEPYGTDDQPQHHIPDFTVDCFVPGLRIEVKALASLVRDDSLTKYAAIGKGYLDRHVPFAFLVDAQLQEAPRFDSVRLLTRYVTSTVPPDVLERAKNALLSGPLSIPELREVASLSLVDVWTLIARRHVTFDWSCVLDRHETKVSLPNQPFAGLKLEDILRSTRFGPLLEELALGRRSTDKQLLADAAAWRQSRRPLTPWQFVGGFAKAAPLRDLREEECVPRDPRRRRDYAPGSRFLAAGDTKA
jgi:hypothetical protein